MSNVCSRKNSQKFRAELSKFFLKDAPMSPGGYIARRRSRGVKITLI